VCKVQLYEYLHDENISQTDFSNKIGVSQPTLSRYVNGDNIPSVIIGYKIEKATKGAVKCRDWEILQKALAKATANG